MKIEGICFTISGYELLQKLQKCLGEEALSCSCKGKELRKIDPEHYVDQSLDQWTAACFAKKQALLFVGAAGIAVRAIAPSVSDKLFDSPVLVMDEAGQYVIPILSGHVGGANELAEKLASCVGAIPVITTATDVRKKFAIDLFAVKQGLSIVNRGGIAQVSSQILQGKAITIMLPSVCFNREGDMAVMDRVQSQYPGQVRFVSAEALGGSLKDDARPSSAEQPGDSEIDARSSSAETSSETSIDVLVSSDQTLLRQALGENRILLGLIPRDYYMGIGCKKGKTFREIKEAARDALNSLSIDESRLAGLASVDIKAEEEGILELAEMWRLPFTTFTAQELQSAEGDFHESDFVRSRIGVGNVCERAAVLAAGPRAEIVCPKQAKDGITIAIARGEWRLGNEA